MINENDLGKLATARTLQGHLAAAGRVIGYTTEPTVIIETPAGNQIHWAASLCTVVDVEPGGRFMLLYRRVEA
ncbi:hypothetical protein LCGC14_2136540 [marine sediment metagenome]|uniref:Uncharacterized protein n=1 Tax=marine sediment metagenome TaxID=412755 RepID=A0A0F9EM26_9ZZZZ